MTNNYIIKPEDISKRLDVFLSEQLPRYSRSYIKELIEEDNVKINNKAITKAGQKLKLNDNVSISIPKPKELYGLPVDTEKMGIKVFYENPDFLIVYKPAGIIVHKTSAKSEEPSLVDWLIAHYKEIKKVGFENRPGIVHRLDKDTSGLLIVARNNYAHSIFSKLFKDRKIEKTYLAVVRGHTEQSGVIDFNIVRDQASKIKMKATNTHGRSALTIYKTLEYFPHASLVEVRPITGRTHQIRVHFAAIGHPLIGDAVYGESSKFIKRQALHAYIISFEYEDKFYTFIYDMPEDMKQLMVRLA